MVQIKLKGVTGVESPSLRRFSGGVSLVSNGCFVQPPKNGEIALVLTTNGLMCSKYVAQTRNEAIDDSEWYKMLLNLIL